MIDHVGAIQPAQPAVQERAVTRPEATRTEIDAFQHLLEHARDAHDLRFSSHAQQRIQSRQIQLTEDDCDRLGDAVERASAKGGNQSLVMLDDLAFIVSVQNRVVITAVDNDSARDGAFTNIDSAVIA